MHKNKNRKKKPRRWAIVKRNPALWFLARWVHVLGFQRIGIWIGRHAVKATEVIG